jgi:hypothetical protein
MPDETMSHSIEKARKAEDERQALCAAISALDAYLSPLKLKINPKLSALQDIDSLEKARTRKQELEKELEILVQSDNIKTANSIL